MKTCLVCDESKPLDDFHRHPQMGDGHLNTCKVCKRAQVRAWAAANPDRAKSIQAAWRARNRRHIAEYQDRRRAADPAKAKRTARAATARRRERHRAATTGRVSLKAILSEHGMVCHICLHPIAEGQLAFDHVVPLSRSGEHSEANLRPSHRVCNSWKWDRLMSELPAGRPSLDEEEWQVRRRARANGRRSAASKGWWRDNPEAVAQRNARMSLALRGNRNGVGNPGRIRTGWGNGLDACAECGTSNRPHKARGLCNACYLRGYRASPSTLCNY